MKITRFGHATLLVETGNARCLVDPGVYSTEWHDLRDIDAVVITHQHPDHFDAESLSTLMGNNPGATMRAPSDVVWPPDAPGAAIETIRAGDRFRIGDLGIETIGGSHALVHERIPRVENIGLVMGADGEALLFHPGDDYETIPPGIDVLAMPLTAPWARAGTTADFVSAVAPALAFPIHDSGASMTGHATYMRLVSHLIAPGIELVPIDALGVLET